MTACFLSFDIRLMYISLSLLIRPYCLFIMTIHSTYAGIEITEIFVPRLRLVGDDAELECRFVRSNGVRVYSIKWWRDNDQFYQYIPRNDPPKMPFNVTGIRVDTSLSSEVRVILRHVTVDTSGAFTCEVMADESFETVRHSDNMTVIDPPDGAVPGSVGPFVEVSDVGTVGPGPLEYNVGKRIEALCIARRAYPAATLTWTINGREAADDFLTPIHPSQEGRNSFTTQLWLSFTVTEGLFDQKGELMLVCNASLGSLWYRHATLILQNPIMRRARNSGLFSSGFCPKLSMSLIASSVAAFFVLSYSDCVSYHWGPFPSENTGAGGGGHARQSRENRNRSRRRRRSLLQEKRQDTYQSRRFLSTVRKCLVDSALSFEKLFINNVYFIFIHWFIR